MRRKRSSISKNAAPANAHIRFLILCGKETRGHRAGQSLLALARNGVAQDKRIKGAEGRRPVLKNLDFLAVQHFRSQIEIIDLIGQEDVGEIKARMDTCIGRNPGRFEKEIAIKKASQVEAHRPERLSLDPSGFFIIYPKKDKKRIYLEHYREDGTLNEVISGKNPAFIASTAIERGLASGSTMPPTLEGSWKRLPFRCVTDSPISRTARQETGEEGRNKMYPGEHFWWGGWWMFPMIMPIVFLIIAIIALYLIFGRGGFRPPWWDRYPGKESESALDILKKRYAKGELTKEEFERMKKDLLS